MILQNEFKFLKFIPKNNQVTFKKLFCIITEVIEEYILCYKPNLMLFLLYPNFQSLIHIFLSIIKYIKINLLRCFMEEKKS